MEGGTKVNIDLESQLDVKSSDMLVPVNQPKFEHNRQRYQGHVLPTSLRYEHNGWAAGNSVYELEYRDGFVKTNPEGYTVTRVYNNNNPNYILNFKYDNYVGDDAEPLYAYYNKETELYSTNLPSYSDENPVLNTIDNITTITGKFNDKSYVATYNSLTKNISIDNEDFVVSTKMNDDYTQNVYIEDITNTVNFDCKDIILPTSVQNFEHENIIYNVADFYMLERDTTETYSIYGWYYTNMGILYNATQNNVIVAEQRDTEEIQVTATDVVLDGANLSFNYVLPFKQKALVKTLSSYYYHSFNNFEVDEPSTDNPAKSKQMLLCSYAADSPDVVPFNFWSYEDLDHNLNELSYDKPHNVRAQLPFWIGFSHKDSEHYNVPLLSDMSVKDLFAGYSNLSLISDDINNNFIPVVCVNNNVNNGMCAMFVIRLRSKILNCELADNFFWPRSDTGNIPFSDRIRQNEYFNAHFWVNTEDKYDEAVTQGSITRHTYDNRYKYWRLFYDFRTNSDQGTSVKQVCNRWGIPTTLNIDGTSPYLQNIMFTGDYLEPHAPATQMSRVCYGNNVANLFDHDNYFNDILFAAVIVYDYDRKIIKEVSNPIIEYDDFYIAMDATQYIDIETQRFHYNVGAPEVLVRFKPQYMSQGQSGRIGCTIDSMYIKDDNNFEYVYGADDFSDIDGYHKISNGVTSEDRDIYHLHENNYCVAACIKGNMKSIISCADNIINIDTLNNQDDRQIQTDRAELTEDEKKSVYLDRVVTYGDNISLDKFKIIYNSVKSNPNSVSDHDYNVNMDFRIVASDASSNDSYLFYASFDDANAEFYVPGHMYMNNVNELGNTDGHMHMFILPKNYVIDPSNGEVLQPMLGIIFNSTAKAYLELLPDQYDTTDPDEPPKIVATNILSYDPIKNVGHYFIEEYMPKLQRYAKIKITPIQFGYRDNVFYAEQDIKYVFANRDILIHYDSINDLLSFDDQSISVTDDSGRHNYIIDLSIERKTSPSPTINQPNTEVIFDIIHEVNLNYACRTRIFKTLDPNYAIIQADPNHNCVIVPKNVTAEYEQYRVIFNYKYNTVTIVLSNGLTETILNPEIISHGLVKVDLKFIYRNILRLSIVIQGIANTLGINVIDIQNNIVTFNINKVNYTVDLNELFDEDHNSYLDLIATDINKGIRQKFDSIEYEKEYQLIKQQWNTTDEVENYWWIDKDHILELNKTRLVLKKKSNNIDDWYGDKWDDIKFGDYYTWPRAEYIDSTVLEKFCTNCADPNETARFCRIISVSKTKFKVAITEFTEDHVGTIPIILQVVKRNIGNKLIPIEPSEGNNLYTYSTIVVDNLITESKLSSTIIDGRLLLGIHLDNNFNQWVIMINLNSHTVEKIIQGYGFVGLHGEITGGEIPANFYSVSGKYAGFNDTVYSLDTLKHITTDDKYEIEDLSELYNIENKVVGTDRQQWYITKNIDKIISHFTYGFNGTINSVILELNNNYSCKYASSSFTSKVLGDYLADAKPLASFLMGNDNDKFTSVWNSAMYAFGFPVIYYMDPKLSTINYLQQSLGQYAYVHKNTTSIEDNKVETTNPEIMDELSFDIQSIKQEASTGENLTSQYLLAIIMSTFTSALDFAHEKTMVNTHQNQTATSDTGRKYSQFFLQNLASMSGTEITIQSTAPTQTSEVTAIKTLDMFYSTSSKQHIHAGPGYVNHNFVAQCVAQSVTSLQLELNQIQAMYIFKALTIFQQKVALRGLEITSEFLKDQSEAYAGGVLTGGGTTWFSNWGVFVSTSLALGASISKGLETLLRVGIECTSTILDMLGSDKAKVTTTAVQSKHNYNIEGKHVYGNKTESFMWPCFDCKDIKYNDESVIAECVDKSWDLNVKTSTDAIKVRKAFDISTPNHITKNISNDIKLKWDGPIDYYVAMCRGVNTEKILPDDMACVIGTDSFLPTELFKNENIGESDPVFAVPVIQDYILDKDWNLSVTATDGESVWVSCKDTKLIDGEPSNIVVSHNFCGVASPYTAIEVKHGILQRYMRPWAITPNVLALNQTGLNVCYNKLAYHGFDGYGYRLVKWIGSAGMNKEHYTMQYSFLVNDRFKRSNKLPPNQFLGNFKSDPVMAITTLGNDKIYSGVMQPGELEGLDAGVAGEDKDVTRYALPIFTEFVSTLPAVVKTYASYPLAVVDGVTSLCTDIRNMQSAYKAPESVDFNISEQLYRMCDEYICSVHEENGVVTVKNLVPALGLTFLGASPYEAYFYNQATRQYYIYTGGTDLRAMDMLERFRDIKNGRWDFINQEVAMPCLATFNRLNKNVHDDKDETDNVIIPTMKNQVYNGEVTPPIRTIFNNKSWFKTLSLPAGLTYQGPNRCIINRFVYTQYMLKDIKDNKGKWVRVPRDVYNPFRKYPDEFKSVINYIDSDLSGWTHNPFLLVTSPLGVSENVDCMFEWEITFAWTVEMDDIYTDNEYACVNICAETMTPGGKQVSEPTHIFLTKELFTRTGNYGYYSFRFQSNNGAGNRERLHIWSDAYIAVSSIQLEYKPITEKRNEILTQQVDVQGLKEM